MCIKYGFTLAEVLITLAVIGVVAAMTLPALVNNQKNRELEAAFKKNYSVIQQALDMYQAQNGDRLKVSDIGSKQLKPIIIKHFKVLKDCGYGYLDESATCIQNFNDPEKNVNPYKTFNNNDLDLSYFDNGQFVLSDGSLILLENVPSSPRAYISVDVNGYKKKPNRWGHDVFTFQLMQDGKLLPMGHPQSDYPEDEGWCSLTSTNAYNGVGCTYKALTDKNYFKNLPK